MSLLVAEQVARDEPVLHGDCLPIICVLFDCWLRVGQVKCLQEFAPLCFVFVNGETEGRTGVSLISKHLLRLIKQLVKPQQILLAMCATLKSGSCSHLLSYFLPFAPVCLKQSDKLQMFFLRPEIGLFVCIFIGMLLVFFHQKLDDENLHFVFGFQLEAFEIEGIWLFWGGFAR